MVARDFFEVLISYEFFSMTVLKVARKSIGERVKSVKIFGTLSGMHTFKVSLMEWGLFCTGTDNHLHFQM